MLEIHLYSNRKKKFHFIKRKKQMNMTKNIYFNRLILINLKAMLSNNVLHMQLYFFQHVLVYLLMVKQNLLLHLDPNLKTEFVLIGKKQRRKVFLLSQ